MSGSRDSKGKGKTGNVSSHQSETSPEPQDWTRRYYLSMVPSNAKEYYGYPQSIYVEDWLSCTESWLRYLSIPLKYWGYIGASLLRAEARDVWRAEGRQDDSTTWEDLETFLRRRFQLNDERYRLRENLNMIRQNMGETVPVYEYRFMDLVAGFHARLPPWELVAAFIHGMQDYLREGTDPSQFRSVREAGEYFARVECEIYHPSTPVKKVTTVAETSGSSKKLNWSKRLLQKYKGIATNVRKSRGKGKEEVKKGSDEDDNEEDPEEYQRASDNDSE